MSTLAATAGFDPHLDVIAAAVIDRLDHPLDTVSVPNTPDGWDRLAEWCARWDVTMVGIEGASGYGRRLAQTLTGAGIEVGEIPTRLPARTRRLDGTGKTDPGDARAIARAAARREGAIWVDRPDSEAVRLLVNHRDSLVAAQTRDINALRAILVEVDPDRAAQLPRLRSAVGFEASPTSPTTGTSTGAPPASSSASSPPPAGTGSPRSGTSPRGSAPSAPPSPTRSVASPGSGRSPPPSSSPSSPAPTGSPPTPNSPPGPAPPPSTRPPAASNATASTGPGTGR